MEDIIKPGYTRISEVLRPMHNFDHIPPEILENKRQIGEELHEAIYLYNECIPIASLREEVVPYFDSFLLWMKGTNAKIISNEKRLYDEGLKITGKYDSIVKMPYDDDLILVDWKTTASYNADVSEVWAMQGTFYHHLVAMHEVPMISNKILFVQLSPKGKAPRVREFQYSLDLMAKCRMALKYYRFYNKEQDSYTY